MEPSLSHIPSHQSPPVTSQYPGPANMMNLDYEPARGKERELRAYREAGRYIVLLMENFKVFEESGRRVTERFKNYFTDFRRSIIMTGIKVEQSR